MYEALSDELEKIAADEIKKKKGDAWKNALILASGAAVGTGVMTAADMLLTKKLGPIFAKLTPNAKRFIVGPLLGLATSGSMLAMKRYNEERNKHE